MIIGIGTGILKISRIENIFNKYGDQFSTRILCRAEHNVFENKNKSISFLAKRFSAKEAARKRGRRGAEVRYTPTKRRRAGDLDHTIPTIVPTARAMQYQQKSSSLCDTSPASVTKRRGELDSGFRASTTSRKR